MQGILENEREKNEVLLEQMHKADGKIKDLDSKVK
jgi:hypothetical protein